jgi:hypothetical protein
MCCESPQHGAIPGAITRKLRLVIPIETFGNLDLLIVNMRECPAQVAHVEPFAADGALRLGASR